MPFGDSQFRGISVGYETSFRGFKVVYLVNFNPHKFVLGVQCVDLSCCWERTAEFYWRIRYLYIFSFSFSLLYMQTFSMDPTTHAIRDLY